MTVINESELAQLSTLDQVLMWSIVSINASNLDGRNNYISDNAAIRAESKDYISWSVTQDDKGRGKFVFSALLPVVNPHPLKDKDSLIERIWSYSPYDPHLQTEDGISGYGWQIGTIPIWVDTTERLLAHVAIIGTNIAKYARLTRGSEEFWATIRNEYWADCQYSISDSPFGGQMVITGYMSIDWHSYINGKSLIRCLNPYDGHASDINCNFPNLMQLWSAGNVDVSLPIETLMTQIPTIGQLFNQNSTAGSLISSYGSSNFINEAVPRWYTDAIQGYKDQSDNSSNNSADIGNTTPQLVESLSFCKEQDPSMASYALFVSTKAVTKYY